MLIKDHSIFNSQSWLHGACQSRVMQTCCNKKTAARRPSRGRRYQLTLYQWDALIVFDFLFLFLFCKHQAGHWVSPFTDSPVKTNTKAWNEHGHQAGDLVWGWKRHHIVFHCWCFRWREILSREKTSSEMSPLPNFKRRKPLCSINRLNRVFVMTTNYLLQKHRG